jgi:arylformamidase
MRPWGALREGPETSRGRRRAMDDEHTTDRRVKLDFEVDFSNGGGLQGQGFRLDIEGEDISDEELARYVVEDMRLLMVEEVRILNKEVIAEEHKRVEPSS